MLGTGGNGAGGQHGVIVAGTITVGTTGTSLIDGVSGPATSDFNYGVGVQPTYGGAGLVSSHGGNIKVVGQGVGSGSTRFNVGVGVYYGGTITAGGSGTVTVIGTGGVGTGGANHGIDLFSSSGFGTSTITSGGGNVQMTGTAGAGSGGLGIDMRADCIATTATGGGALFLTTDSINFDSTATISAGSGSVAVGVNTNGTAINLGGNNASGTLGLTNAELNTVTAGTLTIGNANTGTITISADITRTANTAMVLISNGNIVISGGQINTDGGALSLQPGSNTVQPTHAGTDVTASTLSVAGAVDIDIRGTTADTNYTQLNVAGGVNLAGTTLQLTGSYTPAANDVFTIVSASQVTNTFTGLANGATVSFNGKTLRVTYTNTGVYLSMGAITSTTVTASPGTTTTYGTSVTFTVTVGADPTDQGTVSFYIDGSAYAPATNLSLNSSGQASFSISSLGVTGSPHTITAYFSGVTNVYAPSQGSLGETITPATPSITWPKPSDIVFGTAVGSAQLNATANIQGSFSYTLADGTTPANGAVLNAGQNQTLKVNFTPNDSIDYTTATDSVTINVLQATPQITWSNPGDIVYGTALGATQLDASAEVSGSFTYTLADGKTSANGAILNAGPNQTLNVLFTPDDVTDYTTATDSVVINVLKATPQITWSNPGDIVYGTALGATQLDASADVGGSFRYTLADGNTSANGAILYAGQNQIPQRRVHSQ